MTKNLAKKNTNICFEIVNKLVTEWKIVLYSVNVQSSYVLYRTFLNEFELVSMQKLTTQRDKVFFFSI